MKLSVIGLGQCGGNIADEFYAVNDYATSVFGRRIEILTDAFAINTDDADLGGFRHIPKDKEHRIVIGALSTFGHGVGKINTDAAQIIKSSHSVVTDSILRSKRFHESDAIMCVASGAGGTGSGTIGWVIITPGASRKTGIRRRSPSLLVRRKGRKVTGGDKYGHLG